MSLYLIRRSLETNNELNEKISSLNEIIKTNEDSNRKLIEKIRSEMSLELDDMNKRLSDKEKEIQDLKITISSKEILLNQSKRESIDNKTKCDENIQEIKDFYENKIKSIYKEFDDNYQKIHKQNDEKIIEIRSNCMRTVDKTKDEYENKIYKIENENRELKEKYSHLRLESEAMKMSNPKNFSSKGLKSSASKAKPGMHCNPLTKPKLDIQILDSDEEIEEMKINEKTPNLSSVPKRKKLVKSNDSYLDFVKND